MKLKLYVRVLFVIVYFSIFSCNNSPRQPVGLASCRAMDYSFSYPENWNEKFQKNGDEVVAPSNAATVNVHWEDLSEHPMTLDEYTDQAKKQIIAAEGTDAILSVKRISVNGQPADEVVYTMGSLKLKGIWMVAHHVAYSITYSAAKWWGGYDKHLGEANIIINSFKLNKV